MNIFFTDREPYQCAVMLDDKRLNKMILETAQMLSTTLRTVHGIDDSKLYKATHKNHPCTLWVGESVDNMTWAVDLLGCMLTELYDRLGTEHKTRRIYEYILSLGIVNGNPEKATPPPNCSLVKTPYEYELLANQMEQDNVYQLCSTTINIFECYRITMCHKWYKTDVNTPRWTNRKPPEWYTGRRHFIIT